MARIILAIAATLLVSTAQAQQQQDESFKKAGVCGRCHVISVVEWSMSGHGKAGTDCLACHGASQGHIVDERNNIKPEKVPHGQAIAALCAGCHPNGCPKEKHKAGCQSCHHVHALLNPNKPPEVKDEQYEKRAARVARFTRQMEEGEQAAKAQQWEKARAAYRAALAENPQDRRATARLVAIERRLAGVPPGFEAAGAIDDTTGLPKSAKVAGVGIEMALISGGEVELGSEKFASARPVHNVIVTPFYLAKCELTQAQWTALVGSNPSAHQGAKFPDAARMPVENISWDDAQKLVEAINRKVPGAGFRLPTEAEWEFAARAGTPGDAALEASAWFGGEAPRAVGTKKANALGLFDILGNVWEWTASTDAPYPYDASDGRNGPGEGMRILRGGGFSDTAELLDPAMRHSDRASRKLRWNGLRLARSMR
jgi:formylglycine-generating enzyme required for sulfatase activity